MRDANVYNIARALPRMSWHPRNLYNLWCRSLGGKAAALNFRHSRATLFKQRWLAKALLRAYHGDYIKETIFKRWYLPQTLPDVRRQSVAASAAAASLNKWAQREDAAAIETKRLEEEREKGLAPVVSLIFAEVERRIDVLIFRSCFAQSVYEARRLVIHGQVMLNGKKHANANTRLAPGDMFSVNPAAIKFLQRKAAPQEEDEKVSEKDEAAEEAYAESESESEEAHSEDAAESTTKASESETTSASDRDYRTAGLDKWKAGKGDASLTPFHLPPYASPFIFIPAYIEASFATCSAIYLRHPTARPGYSEIPTPYDADGELMRMAWEWYSKRRSRIRSKSQWAREPENRR